MTPKRIQRKRTKGWKKPCEAVYVGRGTKFGNPFRINQSRSRAQCVEQYRFWIARGISNSLAGFPPQPVEIRALRGRHLMCWCPLDQPCHADVLLELANAGQRDTAVR